MAHASPGKIITAYDVSQEQKRRAEQRGEHLLTFDEINAYLLTRLEQAKREGVGTDSANFSLSSWIEQKERDEAKEN